MNQKIVLIKPIELYSHQFLGEVYLIDEKSLQRHVKENNLMTNGEDIIKVSLLKDHEFLSSKTEKRLLPRRMNWVKHKIGDFSVVCPAYPDIVNEKAGSCYNRPTIRQESIPCQNPGCNKCLNKEYHGNYYYLYLRVGNKLRKRYVGKDLIFFPIFISHSSGHDVHSNLSG